MPRFFKVFINSVFSVCFCLALTITSVSAAILTVTTVADKNDNVCDSDCSLREAITAATANDDINFASPLFDSPQTITLSEATGFQEILINKNLRILGKGANLLTIRRDSSATARFRIFRINGATVTLSGMTVSGGFVIQNPGGGGILNVTGVLTVENSHITGNTAIGNGGGIQNIQNVTGSLTIINSTVSNNTTNGGGGGIQNDGPLSLTNSTVSGNVAGSGGGINNGHGIITNSTITDNQANNAGGISSSGSFTIRGTIVAGNRNNTSVPDVASVFVSQGFNLIGNRGLSTDFNYFNQPTDRAGTSAEQINPRLDPLANYGGAILTHRLQLGSLALDGGNSFGLMADQRGQPRTIDNPGAARVTGGDNTDIGAFESARFAPLVITKVEDVYDGVCDADCSLRDAVAAALRGNEITFASPLFDSPQTITLSDAAGYRGIDLTNKSIAILGKGANLLTINRASLTVPFRIFSFSDVNAGGTLSGITISGGNLPFGIFNGGGGVYANSSSELNIINCRIDGNTALRGGGIYAENSLLNVIRSTISNNTAVVGGGGGIENVNGSLTVTDSTISGNFSNNSDPTASGGIKAYNAIITNSTITDNQSLQTGSASGLFAGNPAVTVRNTIIAGNRNNATFPDVVGVTTSGGYNFIGNVGANTNFNQTGDQAGVGVPLDPRLEPLGNYGGATQTHRLQTNSPAVDRGSRFGSPTDQRGLARPINFNGITDLSDESDIGAYELQITPTAAPISISGRIITTNGDGLRNARVTLTGMNGNARTILSGKSGNFRFTGVQAGETYIINVASRRYIFQTQVIAANEDITELNFSAFSQSGEIGLENLH